MLFSSITLFRENADLMKLSLHRSLFSLLSSGTWSNKYLHHALLPVSNKQEYSQPEKRGSAQGPWEPGALQLQKWKIPSTLTEFQPVVHEASRGSGNTARRWRWQAPLLMKRACLLQLTWEDSKPQSCNPKTKVLTATPLISTAAQVNFGKARD